MDQDLLSLFPSETAPPVQREPLPAKPASSGNGTNPRVRPATDKMHALEQNVQFLKARSHAHAFSDGYTNAHFGSSDEAMSSRDVVAGRLSVAAPPLLVVALIATALLAAVAAGRFLPAANRPPETQSAVRPPLATPTKNVAESPVAQPISPPEVRTHSAEPTAQPAAAQRITLPEGDRPAPANSTRTPPVKVIFRGHFVVDSVPTGATVLINQRPAGTTPLHLADYPAGSYAVWVELDGYERWTAAVRVQANRTTTVRPLLLSAPARHSDTE